MESNRPIQPNGTLAPLFLISGLGGNVPEFENLARHLGENQPVFALQPQGLDGKRSFSHSCRRHGLFLPFRNSQAPSSRRVSFGGVSFGGFVAFEMAHQLRAQGEAVGMIGLLDTLEWHYLERIRGNLDFHARLTLYKSRLDEFLFGNDRWGYLKSRIGQRSKQFLYRAYKLAGRSLPQTFGTVQDINSFAAANYAPRFFSGKVTIFRSAFVLSWKGTTNCSGGGNSPRLSKSMMSRARITTLLANRTFEFSLRKCARPSPKSLWNLRMVRS